MLAMLLATHPVQAQTQPPQGVDAGSVINIVVTPSPAKVTVPINIASTFTATATGGTQKYNPGWSFKSGPTYQWFVDPSVTAAVTISPTNAATVTVSVPAFTAAGTNPVKINCTVTYQAISEDGPEGTIFGSGSTTVPIYAIGGPITGDRDVRYYCDYPTETSPLSADETGHLTAAGGQPAGTTYSWSITGAAVVTDGGATSSVTYRSTGSGKASAVVTYSLNGQSASSPAFDILSHEPKISSAVASGPGADHIYYSPFGYGFDQQKIIYTVVDQAGTPMGGVPVEEVIRLKSYDPMANNNWPLPDQTATTTSGDGTFTDYFSTSNYTLAGYPGDPTELKRPESEPIAYLKHWWYAGPSASNTQKGCVLEFYPNVTFSTNGVTGD